MVIAIAAQLRAIPKSCPPSWTAIGTKPLGGGCLPDGAVQFMTSFRSSFANEDDCAAYRPLRLMPFSRQLPASMEKSM